MLGALVSWFVYAVFLKVAIGVATDVEPHRNSLGRALLTAAVLSGGQLLFIALGPVLLLWPIAWLFIIKSAYAVGWGRAALVWLALVAMAVALVVLVLIPLGLMAGLTFAMFG